MRMRWFVMCMLVVGTFTIASQTEAKVQSQEATLEGSERKLPVLIDTSLSLQGDGLQNAGETTLQDSSLAFCGEAGLCIRRGPGLRIVGLVLNIFLPFAIGSWVTLDIRGGIIGVTGQLLGAGLILLGQFVAGGLLAPIGVLLWVTGIVIAAVGYIVPLFTVAFSRPRRVAHFPSPPQNDFFAKATPQTIPLFQKQF